MEIITGYTGENHVTSADDASLYRGILGQDDYVLEVGSKFAATIIDNNTVRVMDGDLVIQGHQARIRANDYNEVTIDNGTPGQKRNDLIVARYLKNTETGIESITLEVIKGTPGAAAIDPEIIQEDLKVGGTQRDYPLYRVALDGVSLINLTTLFNVAPTIASHLAEKVSYVSHFTRSLQISGVQQIRGLGLRPKAIYFSSSVNASANKHSEGFTDANNNQKAFIIRATGEKYSENVAITITNSDGIEKTTRGTVTIVDDGFDVNWVLSGEGATGTVVVRYLVLAHGGA